MIHQKLNITNRGERKKSNRKHSKAKQKTKIIHHKMVQGSQGNATQGNIKISYVMYYLADPTHEH